MGQKDDLGKNKNVLEQTVPKDVVTRSQRQRILDAIATCCAEKTFALTTISDIVACAGVSRGTFYKQFTGKRSCFEAALDSIVAEIGMVAGAAGKDAAAAAAIREGVAAAMTLLAGKPAYAKLILLESVTVDPDLFNHWRRVLGKALIAPWTSEELSKDQKTAVRAAVGRAQVLLFDRIAAGDIEHLKELTPELVYIALLPFAGQEEALRQARLAP